MQSGKTLDDRWLQEAAEAFQVATSYRKTTYTEEGVKFSSARRMRREQVVDAVVLKVRKARAELGQPAAARDASRRANLTEQWKGVNDVRQAAKTFGVRCPMGCGYEELKQLLCVRSCPEELRLSVVEEFIASERPLPVIDAIGEEFARRYVDSALGRRSFSTVTGEQLTGQQVTRWSQIFALLPVDQELVETRKYAEWENPRRSLAPGSGRSLPGGHDVQENDVH